MTGIFVSANKKVIRQQVSCSSHVPNSLVTITQLSNRNSCSFAQPHLYSLTLQLLNSPLFSRKVWLLLVKQIAHFSKKKKHLKHRMNVTPATTLATTTSPPSEPEPVDHFTIRDGQLRRWATRRNRVGSTNGSCENPFLIFARAH